MKTTEKRTELQTPEDWAIEEASANAALDVLISQDSDFETETGKLTKMLLSSNNGLKTLAITVRVFAAALVRLRKINESKTDQTS